MVVAIWLVGCVRVQYATALTAIPVIGRDGSSAPGAMHHVAWSRFTSPAHRHAHSGERHRDDDAHANEADHRHDYQFDDSDAHYPALREAFRWELT
jgi:hypothetical protein